MKKILLLFSTILFLFPLAHAQITGPQYNCFMNPPDTVSPFQNVNVWFYGFDLSGSIVQASVNWGDGSSSATSQTTPVSSYCSSQSFLNPPTNGASFNHYYTTEGYVTIQYFLTDNTGHSTILTFQVFVDPPTGGGGFCCRHPV